MKIYTLTRKQYFPITLQEAWDFFSSPRNLAKITPSRMDFRILNISGTDKIYTGQIIQYKVKVLPFYSVFWETEIQDVREPLSFVDDQRVGPFALWRHRHSFREVNGGVEMQDEISYSIPFGPLGVVANWLFVEREVNAIFNHRFDTLEKLFPKKSD